MAPPSGPDLAQSVNVTDLEDGKPLLGHVGGEAALLIRRGKKIYATGAKCTHYGAPLQTGIVTEAGIHCPWHHACFRLEDGQVERAPALNPIASYDVIRDGNTVRVGARRSAAVGAPAGGAPPSVTIVGLGAAAMAAATRLRELGYTGPITALGSDTAKPYDRTKLSKGFLGGGVEPKTLALSANAISDHGIDWRPETTVTAIDLDERTLSLAGGGLHPFHTLLLATGARPRPLEVPGGQLPHVRLLRSLDDAIAVVQRAETAANVVIVGASFIGLEAAAALRARKLNVAVVSPHEGAPMAPVLGEALGQEIGARHQKAGIVIHHGRKVVGITPTHVRLDNDQTLEASLVLVAIGVVPNVELAQAAGLATDNGIVVDAQMRTQAANVFAAGDVACAPRAASGERQRIEHWNVAMQMGQVAAANMLGHVQPLRTTPFFWTEHQGLKVRYVGHAAPKARAQVFGDVAAGVAAVVFFAGDTPAAVATVGCDPLSLKCEAALDSGDAKRILPLATAAFA